MLSLLLIIDLAGAEANLSLKTAINEALAHSPSIRAQAEATAVSVDDRWRRYLPNEPQLTYSANDNTSMVQYGVALAIPFPGKVFAMSGLDTARATAARAELDSRRFDVAVEVTDAYLECAGAEATMEMHTQTVNDLETVFATLKAQYESGHGTQAEKIGAELQSRQARADLDVARSRQITSCRKFAGRWAIESGRELPQPDLDLPDDLDDGVVAQLSARTADEARADAQARVAHASITTAWWSEAPDLNVAANRNYYPTFMASPNAQVWTNSISVSMKFPLFFPFSSGADVKRAKALARLDENQAFAKQVGARADVDEARKEYQHARGRLRELREKDLILAQALVESTSSAYRQGRLGFAELILSRKTMADLRAQDINLRTTIVAAHLRCLNSCQGGTP